ncbi:MAG: uracil-DNA glycosylase [Legionellaceae bacterium]|nr:uracil-DNA glycosylase [Legionellaceae bacterium]
MQFMDSILATNRDWHIILEKALKCMDKDYIKELDANTDWLPKTSLILKAFSQPLSSTKYILLGESPYPRAQSANGYAFWDNSIDSIWSDTGLSKSVNRATSLRNIIKMLLLARGDLTDDLSQPAIASLDKKLYIQTVSEFFNVMLDHGFLLLNASMIYSEGRVLYHAKKWRPFIDSVFSQIFAYNPDIKVILLGRVSKNFSSIEFSDKLHAEHPYNLSFITNPEIINFFKPFDLMGVNNG